MLRSALVPSPNAFRAARNVFKPASRSSVVALVRNAMGPLQKDARLARKGLLALGALSACAALPRRNASSEAAETPVTFKMVRKAKAAGNLGTVIASCVNDVVTSCEEADVILIGECHDDQTAHRFEEEFLKRCFEHHKDRGVILSLEMFETDVQGVLDEYLAGVIRERDFMADGRAWTNYMSDYRPLVEFAREHSIPVVAANAPRRYVSRVGSAGRAALSALPPAALKFLPPLPYAAASQAYAGKFHAQMEALHAPAEPSQNQDEQRQHGTDKAAHVHGAEHGEAAGRKEVGGKKTEGGEGKAGAESGGGGGGGGGKAEEKACPYIGWSAERTKHMLDAQVLWDATMAHRILLAGSSPPLPARARPDSHAGASGLRAVADGCSCGMPFAALTSAMLRQGNLKSNMDGADRAGAATARGAKQRPLVVHVCGKFHCENSLGIPEHLASYDKSVRSLVVVCAGWEELSTMEERQVAQLGDFVVVSPPREQKSFASQHPV